MSPIKNYRIDDIKSRFSTVALDNTYQVNFKHNNLIIKEAIKLGFTLEFLNEDLGLYVKDAVLPGSSFGDVEISGDRQGITERVAFSRIYDDITLTFYVDRAYNVLKFFELWNQTINPIFGRDRTATMRFRYPDEYKCDFTISKFNKDLFLQNDASVNFRFASENYKRNAISTYKVHRAWPYSVASVPVNYDGQAPIELNVTFRYDRFTTVLASDSARQELINSQLEFEQLIESGLSDIEGTGLEGLGGAGTLRELKEIENKGLGAGGLRGTPNERDRIV